jgi:hypothetical protein
MSTIAHSSATVRAVLRAGRQQTSSSRYALMWQWSGGGVSNGVGDFDQIDGARQG